ncbi:nicotinate-nucleotide--dimethylbenzimidazole phosphoribosyltransferase [Salmonella enterica]|uniref:nicotinate-nucleotide--dimethylbenzimidazole phosphoribosyltransferase n=1 Tax=Salmonella enterica TaxID=28901 RepID=UPI0003A0AE73
MQTLHALLRDIPAPDAEAMARAQQHIDGLLKPPGSLGRLETLAVQLAGMPGLNGTPQGGEKAGLGGAAIELGELIFLLALL